MRWNCPHCQHSLTAVEAIKNEWSFSQCHRCEGYALIRSGESNAIKVFQAPPGERVVQTRDLEIPKLLATPVHAPALPPVYSSVESTVPRSSRILPILTGLTSAIALASGGYLYVQSQNLFARLDRPAVDRLHQYAMAPDREAEPAAPEADVAPMPTTLAPIGADPGLTAKGEQASCLIKATDFKSSDSSMLLKVKGTSAKLRSGPGLEFPVLMTAGQDLVLEAYDWDGRWFKVRAKSVKPAEGGRGPASVGSSSGFVWIRNDLVERLTDR